MIELGASKVSGTCSERDPMSAAAANERLFSRCSALVLVRTENPVVTGPAAHALWRQ
jgi:hypothetical protein